MRRIEALGMFFMVLAVGCSGGAPEARDAETSTESVDRAAVEGPRCAVLPDQPGLAEVTVEHEGRTFHFCCPSCKSTFVAQPEKYATPE